MVELFANSGYPDQTPRSAASDLGLHCLPVTLLRVSRLQCIKVHSECNVQARHQAYLKPALRGHACAACPGVSVLVV